MNATAQEQYQDFFIKKPIVKERSIKVLRGYTKGFKEIVAHLEATILPMVKEFYANAEEREEDYIFIQGKRVWFSCRAINEFFKLNEFETPEYNSIMGEKFNA